MLIQRQRVRVTSDLDGNIYDLDVLDSSDLAEFDCSGMTELEINQELEAYGITFGREHHSLVQKGGGTKGSSGIAYRTTAVKKKTSLSA